MIFNGPVVKFIFRHRAQFNLKFFILKDFLTVHVEIVRYSVLSGRWHCETFEPALRME